MRGGDASSFRPSACCVSLSFSPLQPHSTQECSGVEGPIFCFLSEKRNCRLLRGRNSCPHCPSHTLPSVQRPLCVVSLNALVVLLPPLPPPGSSSCPFLIGGLVFSPSPSTPRPTRAVVLLDTRGLSRFLQVRPAAPAARSCFVRHSDHAWADMDVSRPWETVRPRPRPNTAASTLTSPTASSWATRARPVKRRLPAASASTDREDDDGRPTTNLVWGGRPYAGHQAAPLPRSRRRPNSQRPLPRPPSKPDDTREPNCGRGRPRLAKARAPRRPPRSRARPPSRRPRLVPRSRAAGEGEGEGGVQERRRRRRRRRLPRPIRRRERDDGKATALRSATARRRCGFTRGLRRLSAGPRKRAELVSWLAARRRPNRDPKRNLPTPRRLRPNIIELVAALQTSPTCSAALDAAWPTDAASQGSHTRGYLTKVGAQNGGPRPGCDPGLAHRAHEPRRQRPARDEFTRVFLVSNSLVAARLAAGGRR